MVSLKVTADPRETGEAELLAIQATLVLESELVRCKLSLMCFSRQRYIHYVLRATRMR